MRTYRVVHYTTQTSVSPCRGTNPGLESENLLCYHYTTGTKSSSRRGSDPGLKRDGLAYCHCTTGTMIYRQIVNNVRLLVHARVVGCGRVGD